MDVQVEAHSTGEFIELPGDESIELPVVDEEDHEEIEDEELLLGNGDETCSIEDETVLADEKVQETIPLVSKDPSLRGYQIELAKPALEGKNSIICAPTGSGKTWIAGYICQEMKQKARDSDVKPFKAAFIVCQRTLVQQQHVALTDFLGRKWDIKAIGDNETDNIMADVVESNDILVITAQKFLNSLNYKSRPIALHQFHVIIMDECHHTDLGHPYNEIMNLYHRCKKEKPHENLPLIVGLTASLGVGSAKEELKAEEHYIKMCANLDCYAITHVRDPANREELEKYNPKPSKDQIKAVERRANRQFHNIVADFMKEIEGLSNKYQPPDRGTQQYESWIMEKLNSAIASEKNSDDIVACEMLNNLNKVLMIFDEFRTRDANRYLRECMSNLESRPCTMQENICQLLRENNRLEQIKLLEEKEKLTDCPLLNELYILLQKIYKAKPESKGILLTKTREEVTILLKFIKEQKEFEKIISPEMLVGHGGQKRTATMTQHGQENALNLFRLDQSDPDRINLLVATDVAQEGLDMPKCNFVIRYNFVSNEIGSVQSKGRARAPESEVYLIVTNGAVNQTREWLNLQKEHLMQETLQKIAAKPADELSKRISERQKKNWIENMRRNENMKAKQNAVDVEKVNIYCAKCKSRLCAGTEICKIRTMYVCVAEDFEEKVRVEETQNGMEFPTEKYIGTIHCIGEGCPKNQLGQKVTFKQGSRSDGFILSRQGCVWKTDAMPRYEFIKQWSKVPFPINEEF